MANNDPFFKDNIQALLNGLTPGAARAKLGDIIVSLQETADGLPSKGAAVANIADPATATATDIANKVNALLTSLRNAGLIAS